MGLFDRFRTPRTSAVAPATPVESPSAWKKPIAEMEERLDYLEDALGRLRGRVTGKLKKGADPVEVESSEVDHKPAIVQESELDRWQQLSNARRAKRGVLPG